MSLRAKIESVIYASEEPVTLPQLASVFAGDLEAALATLQASADEPATPSGPRPAASEAPDSSAARDSSAGAVPEPATETSMSAPAAGDTPAGDNAATGRVSRQKERALRDTLRAILDSLIAEYAASDRGIEIREVAGGYRMATKPEYHDAVRQFVKSLKPPMKLSLQALETLAVVAYKQPVTAPEISEIRGVETSGVLGGLLSRKLITTAGRKQVIGRPILYKTTREFLLRFGLKDLNELPSIEEFEKMAGALAEADLSEAALNGTDTPDLRASASHSALAEAEPAEDGGEATQLAEIRREAAGGEPSPAAIEGDA